MALPSPIFVDAIGPTATVWWAGKQYHALTPLADGWELANVFDRNDIKFLSREALEDGVQGGVIHITKPDSTKFVPPGSNFSVLSDFEEHVIEEILYRYFWAAETVAALEEGKIASLGLKSLTPFMAEIAPLIASKIASIQANYTVKSKHSPRSRGAFTLSMKTPSPRSVQRYVKKFVDSKFDMLCFRWQQDRSCMGGRRLEPEVIAIIKSEIPFYASERNPSIVTLSGFIDDAIDAVNAKRSVDEKLRHPCVRTVGNYIRRAPAAMILGGRKGFSAIRQTFGPIGHGPEYYRVGERIELDGWNPHIYLQKHDDYLKAVPAKERSLLLAVGKRINVVTAIDAASAYGLACVAGQTENTSVAEAALRMAVSDKSEIARWADCTAPWYHCGIEHIAFDNGPAFSGPFRRKALMVTGNQVQPPAKLPWLRAHIESLHAQLAEQFVAFFTGRSFANVAAKGDYDAAHRASLDVEEFMKAIIKYIVDVYNCKENRSDKLSPRRRFDKLASECEPRPSPSRLQIRSIFGIEHRLKLGPRGITWLGINYDSDWLLKHRSYQGLAKIRVKIDPSDLGEISVMIDNKTWLSVPSIKASFNGLSLLEWEAIAADLDRKFGHAVERDYELHVRPAMKHLRKMAIKAEEAAGLREVSWDLDTLKQYEDRMRMRVVYDRPAREYKDIPAVSRGTIGTQFLKRNLPPPETPRLADDSPPMTVEDTEAPPPPMKTRDQ